MRISDWSSDVCSSDLATAALARRTGPGPETIVVRLRHRPHSRQGKRTRAQTAHGDACTHEPKRPSTAHGPPTRVSSPHTCRHGFAAHHVLALFSCPRFHPAPLAARSEGPSLGKECVRTCKYR